MKGITIILFCCLFCFSSCEKKIHEEITFNLLQYQTAQNDRLKNLIISSDIDTTILSYETLLLFYKGRMALFKNHKHLLTKMINQNKCVYTLETVYNTYSVKGCIWSGKYQLYYSFSLGDKPITGTPSSKKEEIQDILENNNWMYMKSKVVQWNRKELLFFSENSPYIELNPSICSKIEFKGSSIKELDILFLYQFPMPISEQVN